MQKKKSAGSKKSTRLIKDFPHSEIESIEAREIEQFDPVPRSILKASTSAFIRWGFVKTTLTDIAREAGISRANIYNYFPDGKDAILQELLQIKAAAFDEKFLEVIPMAGPAADIFVNRLVFGIEHAREDPLHVELISSGELDRLMQFELLAADDGFWHRAFIHAAERGDLKSGVDFADGFRWVYLVLVSILYLPQGLDRTEDVRERLEKFLIPALCS